MQSIMYWFTVVNLTMIKYFEREPLITLPIQRY